MQGDSLTGRRSGLRFLAILATAHIGTAGLVVATLHQVGQILVSGSSLTVALRICVVFAITAVAIDIHAMLKGDFSVGLRRQTPKSLIHNASFPNWVSPFFWGADTGMIWSTFRVSSASWILLIAATLNIAPPWAGVVYGLGFAGPLLAAIVRRPGRSSMPRATMGTRVLRNSQLAGVIIVGALPVGFFLVNGVGIG